MIEWSLLGFCLFWSLSRDWSFDRWSLSFERSFVRLVNFYSYISNFFEDSDWSRLDSVGLLPVEWLIPNGLAVLTERLLSKSESTNRYCFFGRFLRLPLIGMFCKYYFVLCLATMFCCLILSEVEAFWVIFISVFCVVRSCELRSILTFLLLGVWFLVSLLSFFFSFEWVFLALMRESVTLGVEVFEAARIILSFEER